MSTDAQRARIVGSALWAAYGDALGFICELTDRAGVVRRCGHFPVADPVAWRRRIGGRGGPTVELPAGCLSDDTQLRLAVCRCLSAEGFDVDAFAKVELTVWPAYALGAGRGSQAAAAGLGRRDVSASTNFFDVDRARYVDGGGNGAAMRIAPHVWASPPERPWPELLTEVYVDAVVTHGHPRGLMGAGLHALALRRALNTGTPATPDEWLADIADLSKTAALLAEHEELGGLWLSMWTQRTGRPLAEIVAETVEELIEDALRLQRVDGSTLEGAYQSAVEALGAYRPEQRGSAVKTALLANWLAWHGADTPLATVRTAANALGTDTDSIATMAGALLGAVGHEPPDAPIADRDYIVGEAERMWALSRGHAIRPFPHPDLRHWQAPRTQSDALLTMDQSLAVAGLGLASPVGDVLETNNSSGIGWQWVRLWFGQRVLTKRRQRPGPLSGWADVPTTEGYMDLTLLDVPPADLVDGLNPPQREDGKRRGLDELTDEIIARDFDAALLGRHVLELSEDDDGIERALAYVAIVAKARTARRHRDRRRRNGGG